MNKGFGLVGILFVVIAAVIAIGVGGAYVINNTNLIVKDTDDTTFVEENQKDNGEEVVTEQPKNAVVVKDEFDETADWKTYSSRELGIEVKYPQDWILTKDNDYYIDIQKNLGGRRLSVKIGIIKSAKYNLFFPTDDMPTSYQQNKGEFLSHDAYFSTVNACAGEGGLSVVDCYLQKIDAFLSPISKKVPLGKAGETIYVDLLKITYGVSKTFENHADALQSYEDKKNMADFKKDEHIFNEILDSIKLLN
jgi:hypothetical protein